VPWDALALVAIGVLLFGWRLGSHDLWPTDEPRFGEVAREMWEGGDRVVLSLNGHRYTEKPPLFFWTINGFAHLTGGVDETAARLPSALAAVLALLLILRLGEVLYDRPTGFLAAIVFATSVQILERARWASIDMTLNLFVLAAILLLWQGTAGGAGGRWRVPLAWAAMGCATLAKGPVGLVLPLLVLAPATILVSGWRALRRLAPPAGVALYLAVTLAWFVPFALRIGPGDALGILTHQTVERYVDAWNAQHPVWYYLWRFPAGFFPWIVFLPWSLHAGLARPRPEGERRSAIVLSVWIAAIFVFFSLSTGKRGVYIIPLYPAASLLVARLFRGSAEPRDGSAGKRRLLPAFSVWAAAASAAAAAIVLTVPRRHPDLRGAVLSVAVVLLAAAGLSLWLAARGRTVQAALSVAACMGAILLVCTESVVPWANGHLNLSGFAGLVRPHLRDEIPLAATEEKRDAWVYYTRRFVEEVDSDQQVLAYLGGPPPRDLLVEEECLARLRAHLPDGVQALASGRVSGRPYHLLRREAAP
jgi:4-amino-4-deoxy-L-arabinose transferase-like glycosyltransferase